MTGLLVFTVFAAAGAGLVWLVLRGRELERQVDLERRVLARKAGWEYESLREPGRASSSASTIEYRFSGSEHGVAWTMEYDCDRGKESPTPRAVWTSENLRTAQLALVILGRTRYELESGTAGRLLLGVMSGVVEAVSGRSVGPMDKSAFYDSAVRLASDAAAANPAFVAAVTPDMPRDWFDAPLQALLARWPETSARFRPEQCLEATLDARGLRLVAQHMPPTMANWQHLAKIGDALGARLAAAARGGRS